ncbi:hypothetical protein CcrColossus_gp297 [Caulobacter phage CcrColossus]|uniref:Uncharacterized protein n=1 Tax=Caulobacter phage CcrColossus TaxID=1211640 RepID=K4K6I4_9CAUD|nr:hypothetical protein CcrColossus_gp297 [Caulobacter phage CcrColossus]AFU88167.1 hypothetical protein CcrColossus_gp297 [Caulobacter phage CcrColossus]
MTQAFEIESRQYGDTGAKRPFIIAHCSGCDAEEAIADPKGSGAVPLQYAQKLFTRKGWELGSVRAKDLCPSCVRSKRGRKAEAPKQVLKGVDGPIPADPSKADTMLGAKLIEAARLLTEAPKVSPAPVAQIREPHMPAPIAQIREPHAPPAVNPTVEAPKGIDLRSEERLAASRKGGHNRIAQLTPEERSALARKGAAALNSRSPEERAASAQKAAQTRRERAAERAEIKRLADEQAAEARREKMGRGIKGFWAGLTKEQRSERGRVAAATRAAKLAAEKAGVPFIHPKRVTPQELAQAKVKIARATSAAKKPQESAMPAAATINPAPTSMADQPRQATREQNQKILEKLHEVYDTSDPTNPHYVKTYTDKQVAEELHYPAAWIAAVRDQFFGPEKNEAAEVFIKDVKELKTKQADLKARFTKHFDDLTKMEDEMRRLEDAIAQACRRAGVPVN